MAFQVKDIIILIIIMQEVDRKGYKIITGLPEELYMLKTKKS